MKQIEESDYKVHKAIAEKSVRDFETAIKKIDTKCMAIYKKYSAQKEKFLQCENFENLEHCSEKIVEIQKVLNHNMAIRSAFKMFLLRNQERQAYLKAKLDELGIYNDSVEKKQISTAVSGEEKNVSEKSLNLKQKSNNGEVYVFFEGEILLLKKGRLSFEEEFNKKVLLGADSAFIKKVIAEFPYSVSTIPDDVFLNTPLKLSIATEIVLFVSNALRTKTMREANKMLGNILNVDNGMKLEDFASELKNLVNVNAKRALKEICPKSSDEIDAKIQCNEQSPFLPARKKVAVLANGMGGDVVKTEEQESEEVRKEKEKEQQELNEINALLKELIEKEQEQNEERIEQQTQEELDKLRQDENEQEMAMSMLKKDGWNV